MYTNAQVALQMAIEHTKNNGNRSSDNQSVLGLADALYEWLQSK